MLAVWSWAAMYVVDDPARIWIGVDDPPFIARLRAAQLRSAAAALLLRRRVGNIVKRDGFDFDEFGYASSRSGAWRRGGRCGWLGPGLGIVLLAKIGGSLWDGRGRRGRGTPLGPEVALYLLGAA